MQESPSPSRVVKIPDFQGRLPPRALYIYLPPGYDDEPDRRYPLLFMHDGQNCFEAFADDSYVGSWRADETADRLINEGSMRPCLIVGVSHGGEERLAEYLPPYATFQLRRSAEVGFRRKQIRGRADETFAYYRDDVAPYLCRHYRVLSGRDNRATCGSSMGGLFSTYIAWEHPEFARHHAILSPALRITRGLLARRNKFIERLRDGKPRDLRLWLDSGTLDAPGRGDDGMKETAAARDALLGSGYVLGANFQYRLDKGAIHHESAWAARLPQVFRFLFPPESETASAVSGTRPYASGHDQ
jgi:predicted alpha/beta superfamily hydrolase